MTVRLTFLVGLWLITSLFCNDTTEYGSIHLGINLRPDRVIYFALVFQFLMCYRGPRKQVRWILEEKLMLLFFLILLMSCFLGGGAFAPNNRYLGKLFSFSFVPATIFMLARRLDFDPVSERLFWKVCTLILFYLGITGIFEHCHVDWLIFPKYIINPHFGLHFGRVRGPFVQAAVEGGALIMIALWILWYHLNVRRSFVTWVVLPTALASIYWTNTRGVWVAFAASALILAMFPNRLRKGILWVFLLLAVVYFSGVASKFSAYRKSLFKQRVAQVDDRLNIYYASWRMFCARPLFGFGYGSYETLSDAYFVRLPGVEFRGQGEGQHHTILGLMCETGVVGTVPFCLLYYLFCRKCYQIYHNSRGRCERVSSLALTLMAILGGSIVGMQFSDFGFYHFINDLTFWQTGLLYGMADSLPSEAPCAGQLLPEDAVGELRHTASVTVP